MEALMFLLSLLILAIVMYLGYKEAECTNSQPKNFRTCDEYSFLRVRAEQVIPPPDAVYYKKEIEVYKEDLTHKLVRELRNKGLIVFTERDVMTSKYLTAELKLWRKVDE